MRQATLAEERGDLGRAASYVRRFLAERTDDIDARAHLSLLLEQTARTREERFQAFLEMEEVLRRSNDRNDIRRRDIGLALGLQLYTEAEVQIKRLQDSDKTDGTVYDLYGQCLNATGRYPDAAATYKEATEYKPDLVQAYGRRATILRQRLNDSKAADETIDKMVEANKESAQAHLIAAYYWRANGKEGRYADEVRAASRIDREDPEVVLAVVDLAAVEAANLTRRKDSGFFATVISNAKRLRIIEESCGVLSRAIEKRLPEIAVQPKLADRDAWVRLRRLVANMFSTLISFQEQIQKLAEAEHTALHAIESLPENVELRLQLADVCILRREWDQAQKPLAELDQSGSLAAPVNYRYGQIASGQDKTLDAIRFLESAAAQVAGASDLAQQIQLLLGQSYERIGLLDKSSEAYLRAMPQDVHSSAWAQISIRLARILTEKGQIREAIEVYKQVAVLYPAAFTPLGRLRLIEALRQPPSKREWGLVEEALKGAPESVEREMLQADLKLAKGEESDARKLLESVSNKYKDSIDPIVGLAYLDLRDKKPEQALERLDRAERQFGDRISFRLFRARIIVAGAPSEMDKQLEPLTERLDRFSADDRRQLLRGIAEIATTKKTGHDLVDRLWDRLATEAPDDLGVQLVRFDRAMASKDETRLLNAKEKIADLERKISPKTEPGRSGSVSGDSTGSVTRTVEALYVIWKARQTGRTDELANASAALAELERERPNSPQVPLAQASIYELEHRRDLALEQYRRAFNLGNHDPEVVRRLVELHYERKEYTEAEAILRQLPEGAEIPENLQQVAAEVSLQAGKLLKALELAEKAVHDDSKDYAKQMWLARVRWLAGKRDLAEHSLLLARDLAPEKPDAWIALVQLYTRTERLDQTPKIIEEAKARISKPDVPLAVAQCYEITGQFDLAGQLYDKILKESPDDVQVLKNAASLRLREGNREETQILLNRILKNNKRTEQDERFAKRLLAITVSLDPDYEKSRNALVRLGLLNEERLPKPLTGAESVEDIRDRAIAFAMQRDLPSKRQAIRDLEESSARRPLADADQFLLAQLYVAVGEWEKAKRILASMVRTENPNPTYVAYYAFGLIRERDLDEAEKWVKKLEELQKDSIRTTELRARLLARRGEIAKATQTIIRRVGEPELPLGSLASLLEQIGAGDAAEPLYKKLVADSKKPETVLVLAMYYGRRNRLSEALVICARARESLSAEMVSGVCVAVLYGAKNASPEQIGQVSTWLEEALKKKPNSAAILNDVAALRNLQGDYAGAISEYRRVVAIDPKNAIAFNNLAFLLSASQGKHDDALLEVERAKTAIGPLPTLLDTEAQIYIAKGLPSKAIGLLSDAIAQGPKASYYYHLAMAYFADNRQLEAKEAWRQADKLTLSVTDLHPLEREGFQKFKDAITAK